MPRVAYITCDSPTWHDIADRMARDAGWQPVYWIAEPQTVPVLESRFPGVIGHSRYDAYEMVSPPALASVEIEPLDEPFLRQMSDAQAIALKMMDVMDSVDAFDFNERRRFFQQRLRYWRAIVRSLQIDLAVFAFSGHVVYDYVIYELCRLYGIRTIMFETTFNYALLFAMEDPMVGSTEIKSAYQRLLAQDTGEDVPLPELYESYLARLRGRYEDAVPWYMRQQFETLPSELKAGVFVGEGQGRTGR